MVERLMGVSEIADLLGVSKQRADQLTRSRDFPVPTAKLASGRIWLTRDVVRWAQRVGRFPSEDEP